MNRLGEFLEAAVATLVQAAVEQLNDAIDRADRAAVRARLDHHPRFGARRAPRRPVVVDEDDWSVN